MKNRLMRLASVGLLTICVAACGANKEDQFRAGVPDNDSVTIKAPQKANSIIGKTAEWYEITFGATTAVNGTVLAILGILHGVVSQPATSHSGNEYVWGPGNGGNPLEPLMYKLTVTDNGDHTYDYKLDARDKNAPDDPSNYQTILSGHHEPVVNNNTNDDKHGQGTFVLDWDARAKLPIPPKDANGQVMQGTWAVSYAHPVSDDSTVDVSFNNQLNKQGQPINSTYHYSQPKGGQGKFQFSTYADVNTDGTNEFVTVESRWNQDGSGRADVEISQGSVPAGESDKGTQCWDSTFTSVYENVVFETTSNATYSAMGGQESACTISGAEYYNG